MYTLNLSTDSINILFIVHLKKATIGAKCIKLVTCFYLHFVHIFDVF